MGLCTENAAHYDRRTDPVRPVRHQIPVGRQMPVVTVFPAVSTGARTPGAIRTPGAHDVETYELTSYKSLQEGLLGPIDASDRPCQIEAAAWHLNCPSQGRSGWSFEVEGGLPQNKGVFLRS